YPYSDTVQPVSGLNRRISMARFCASCGTQMADTATTCAACGKAVAQSVGGGAAVAPAPVASQGSGLSDTVASGLAYITIIPAILFLIIEPYNRNKTIKFHALQCLGLALA